jgi:ComF family protein
MASVQIVQPPYCERCGDPVDGQVPGAYTCAWCARRAPGFDRARSRGVLKELLHRFKYGRMTHLSVDLVRLLTACVDTHYARGLVDAVAFVPLYPRRERERSFNQSRLLAQGVARFLQVPVARRCLTRVRPTATQTDLNASQRRANVRGAFAAANEDWIEGRRFLLVDDVMTTGATVDECSDVLKRAGATAVYVATVARG